MYQTQINTYIYTFDHQKTEAPRIRFIFVILCVSYQWIYNVAYLLSEIDSCIRHYLWLKCLKFIYIITYYIIIYYMVPTNQSKTAWDEAMM